VTLEPGAELVAFSRGTGNLAEALNDPSCERIEPAKEALSDVLFARDAEAAGLPPASIIAVARQRAPQLGYLGAEYVTAKVMKNALPDPATFDVLMQLIETPELREPPRINMIQDACAKVIDSENPPGQIVQRLVIGLFRVLAIPKAAKWRSRILENYLPGVLRLDQTQNRRKAAAVFQARSSDLTMAERWLSANRSQAGADRLLKWLKEP
jgi:hypothetical protein